MMLVFLLVFGIDEEVINVDNDELVQEGSEQVLHHCHEGGRRVGQAKRHYPEFIVPIASSKSRLFHIIWVDAYLVVA